MQKSQKINFTTLSVFWGEDGGLKNFGLDTPDFLIIFSNFGQPSPHKKGGSELRIPRIKIRKFILENSFSPIWVGMNGVAYIICVCLRVTECMDGWMNGCTHTGTDPRTGLQL